jgi:anti-sigma regulatory factor (Ser/Thr protein kinase)
MIETVEAHVNSGLDNLAEARSLIAETVAGWHREHLVKLVVLVGHELVANALRHGAAPVRIRILLRPESIVVEVRDSGPELPRIRQIDNAMSTSGRGLRIVASLSRTWGVRLDEGSKTVWAEIPQGSVQPADMTSPAE